MSREEVALQITLKAIEQGSILTETVSNMPAESANKFNAEQISAFYNRVYDAIKVDEAPTVQEI